MIQVNKILGILLCFTVVSCGSEVTRLATSPETDLDLSGRWNDVDARLVAEEMTQDIIDKILKNKQFIEINQGTPILMVGNIVNKTHEHIEAETFIKDIERNLLNSGVARIITNSLFRERLRDEKAYQAGTDKQKIIGSELGAEFMLFGSINSIVDTKMEDKVINYQVSLELVKTLTNEVVWMGDKKIKKYIGKPGKISKHKAKNKSKV
jgi:uncharacterized protein (TIGR02722 family)